MIEYLLGEHPVGFIVVWETTALAGYALIRTLSRSMTLEDQVKHLNENRAGRTGTETPDLVDGEPEMATRMDAPEHIPDWMDKG